MPTGYTAKLMESGQEFREFVLTCARAMGATIMQRDDPMNEPPRLEEPSDYHVKALAEAKATVARLQAMDNDARLTYGEQKRIEAIASSIAYRDKSQEENERLGYMANLIDAWEPPSPEHEPFKKFMLEQIKISRHDMEWTMKRVADASEKTSMAYFVEALSQENSSIRYHEENHAKEIARTGERNTWIEQLYASL